MHHLCCDNRTSRHFQRWKQITNRPATLSICNSICNVAYNPHPDLGPQPDKDHLCPFIQPALNRVVCKTLSPYSNTAMLWNNKFCLHDYMIAVLVYKRSANKPFSLKPHEEITGKNFRVTAGSSSFKHQEKFEEFNLSTVEQLHIILHSNVIRNHSNTKYRQNF